MKDNLVSLRCIKLDKYLHKRKDAILDRQPRGGVWLNERGLKKKMKGDSKLLITEATFGFC